MHKLRRMFVDHIADKAKSKDVALLLSSGLDSLVVGLAAQEAGLNVHAYTFQMGDNQSFDSKHAEIVAGKLDWPFTLVKVPTSTRALIKAWPILHANYECVKKRDYECAYPMFYCYSAIAKDGFDTVLSGLVADGYFLFNRSTNIAKISGLNSIPEKFHAYRRAYFKPYMKRGNKSLGVNGYNPSGMLQHILMCKQFRLTHINPWMIQPVHDFLITKTWLELNKPKQKMPLLKAWAEEIAVVGHRVHRGYQTEAKVPMYFEKLLEVPEINFKNRKRILDVARDWHKEK